MIANWSKAISLLLVSEGPELNVNPPGTLAGQGEPGGASRYGVSVSALSDFYKSIGDAPATVQSIIDLTESQATLFYRSVTAKACRFDDLPNGIDYTMLDLTCTLGPSGSAWVLQNVLGIWPFVNSITDQMIATVKTIDPKILIWSVGSAWLVKKRMQSDLGWQMHGHGWTNRMNRVRGDALAMSGA